MRVLSEDFLSKTSLLSLGSYCAVANAFEALGLREAAGPFDWMRTECTGLTHLPLSRSSLLLPRIEDLLYELNKMINHT